MALNTNALCTLAQVKTFISETADGNDAIIEQAINHFSTAIEQFTRRRLKLQSINERFTGSGAARAWLPWAPISSITNVQIYSAETNELLEDIVPPRVWVADAGNGELALASGVFPAASGACLFDGRVGYSVTHRSYPTFKQALLLSAFDFYKRWQGNNVGLVSKSYPEGSADFIPAANLSPQVRSMLRSYRRESI